MRISYCCVDGNILYICNNRLYNVEFSFVKVCIHFFGGPCIPPYETVKAEFESLGLA